MAHHPPSATLEAVLLAASLAYVFSAHRDSTVRSLSTAGTASIVLWVVVRPESKWGSARWMDRLDADPRHSHADKSGIATGSLLPILVAKAVDDTQVLDRALAAAIWIISVVLSRGFTAQNAPAALLSRFLIGVAVSGVDSGWNIAVSSLSAVLLLASLRRWKGCLSLGEAALLSHAASEVFVLAWSMLAVLRKTSDVLSVAGLLLSILPPLVISPPQPSRVKLVARFTAVVSLIIYPWAYMALGNQEPMQVMLHFCLGRWRLCGFWLLCLFLIVFVAPPHKYQAPGIMARKAYHIAAVIMFTPAIFSDGAFLKVAMSWALAMLLLFELVRQSGAWRLPVSLTRYMTALLDERDSGVLVMTHLHLLLGCAFPVLVAEGNERIAILGIAVLGLGDTMASVIGSRYGRVHWPASSKTLEGTFGGWAGTVIFHAGLWACGVVGDDEMNWWRVVGCSLLVSLFESFTCQIDNLVLSPYLYAMVATW